MNIVATRARFGERLVFGFDPESRAVTGPGADWVRGMVGRWDGVGILYGTQPVEAPDPLGSPRDMAVMLADAGYDLPDELADLLPPAEEVPEGAVA